MGVIVPVIKYKDVDVFKVTELNASINGFHTLGSNGFSHNDRVEIEVNGYFEYRRVRKYGNYIMFDYPLVEPPVVGACIKVVESIKYEEGGS